MIKRTVRWLATLTVSLLALTLIGITVLYGWLCLHERDITQEAKRFLPQKQLAQHGYQLQLDKATIIPGNFRNPFMVRIENLKLLNKESELLISIPGLRVAPNYLSLLDDIPTLSLVEMTATKLDLSQDESGRFYLGTVESRGHIPLSNLTSSPATSESLNDAKDAALDDWFAFAPSMLRIQNASLHFHSERSKMDITLPSLSLEMQMSALFDGANGTLTIHQQDNAQKENSSLQARFTYIHPNRSLALDAHINRLHPAKYANLHESLSALKAVDTTLSGNIRTNIQFPYSLKSLTVDLGVNEGSLYFPDAMQTPLPLDYGTIKIESIHNAASLRIRDLSIKGHNYDLKASGLLQDWLSPEPMIELKAQSGPMSFNFLKKHWPKTIGKDAYRWINASLEKGMIRSAEAKISLKQADYRAIALPKEAIQARIDVEDATVNYVPGFPKASAVKGSVFFEGASLRAEVETARLLSHSHMEKGEITPTVTIPDLTEENIRILLDFPVQSNPQDIISFLNATPRYKLPPSLPIDATAFKGNISGHLKMAILDHISPKPDEVDFNANVTLHNLQHPALIPGLALQELSGTLEASNEHVSLSSTGQWNEQEFTAKFNYKDDINIDFSGYFPSTFLKLAGSMPSQLALKGGVNAESFHYHRKANGISDFKASLNLEDLAYSLPYTSIKKPRGTEGHLKLRGLTGSRYITLSDINWSAPTHRLQQARLRFDMQKEEILYAHAKQLKLGKGSASLAYDNEKEWKTLTLKGDGLDLSTLETASTPLAKSDNKASHKLLPKWVTSPPDMVVDIELATLYFKKGGRLDNVLLRASCKSGYCQALKGSFETEDASLNARIYPHKGKRRLQVNAKQLGTILQQTGAFSDMKNGNLTLEGIFRDDQPGRPLIGQLKAKEFNVKNIPVLARLLTIATFTGIVDSLSGGGIYFDRMELPFRYDGNTLTIRQATAKGPSVGLTADGMLDLAEDTIKLDGVMIPAKLLDTLLGNIPLLGNIYRAVTGDEGLVAMNYTMREKVSEPEISVNPLSALTPGFLKGFIGLFEQKTAAENKLDQELKEMKSQLQQ